MYPNEALDSIPEDALEIMFASTALFDQYDEMPSAEAANADEYDNLYPPIG